MNRTKGFFSKYGNAYFFLGFWLILFVFFTLLPIGIAVVISFTNFDMVQAPRFVGVANYIRMFLDDDIFVKAFSNTMLFALIHPFFCGGVVHQRHGANDQDDADVSVLFPLPHRQRLSDVDVPL